LNGRIDFRGFRNCRQRPLNFLRVDMPIAPHWMHSGDLRPRDALVAGKRGNQRFVVWTIKLKSTAT
jgi:hypothetical protein